MVCVWGGGLWEVWPGPLSHPTAGSVCLFKTGPCEVGASQSLSQALTLHTEKPRIRAYTTTSVGLQDPR